jgi:phosphodiesterase/alkaline phosphatase D-like protein
MSTEIKDTIRFAQFNASLNRTAEGRLVTDLANPNADTAGTRQAKAVAEIIQRNNPDVVLINEFDYDTANPEQAVRLFLQNYLNQSQNGAGSVDYPYFYIAPSNTGLASGFDLDNNGAVVSTVGAAGYGNDAFGFGNYPGQFGMLLLSKYPIDTAKVRTFQKFLWQDMPDALLSTIQTLGEPWYSPTEQAALRLSSKSHWDVPIQVNGQTIHALVSHPTPPVFDGPEDRNGKRNHDEIRFWSDYVTPGAGGYIYDDQGRKGALAPGSSFVIMGDQNADPLDGDSFDQAILQLLENPYINTSVTPSSTGAVEAAQRQHNINDKHRGNPAFDTADFSDVTPGNLRSDYVLPSQNLKISDAQVFWPTQADPLFRLIGEFDRNFPPEGFPSSDHKLVSVDVRSQPNSLLGIASGDTSQTSTVLWAQSSLTGPVRFEYSTDPDFEYVFGYNTANVTDPNQPVKIGFGGLTPGQTYYYRATDAAGAVKTGQFKTAHAIDQPAGFRFGVSGDWRGELSPYPAIRNASDRNLELFVLHGDTIYSDFESPILPGVKQAKTVDQFRLKYSEVYGERYGLNTWGDLRAKTSVLATIDDHEVTDNFEGGEDLARVSPEEQALYGASSGLVNDSPLYDNGLQAFQDYHPIQDRFYGQTGDLRTAGERQLYRYNTYGKDAATFILDARSFRDAELPAVINLSDPQQVGTFLARSFDRDPVTGQPTSRRTLLGQQQLSDLKRDLLQAEQAGVTWKFVMIPEPTQNLGVLAAGDRYEGYAAERTELLKFIKDQGIGNVVFVAADIHGTVVNNLTYQLGPGQPQVATNAFEITTGSVAFDAPFGPTVAELGAQVGLLTAEQKRIYDALPVANDTDSLVNDKDDFIKQIVNGGLSSLGYDPVGLNTNLPQADGLIQANLLKGDYVATHTYGWTEFDIDQRTQKLTVTTYGINSYSEAELLKNPGAITGLMPTVVSQFEVLPV